MAKDFFSEIKFLDKGDFSQKEIVSDSMIIGRESPTSFPIYKANSNQIIFLELWNETERPISVFLKVSNRIVYNSNISNCDGDFDAHSFHKIEMNYGDELWASASMENSVSYNIIL